MCTRAVTSAVPVNREKPECRKSPHLISQSQRIVPPKFEARVPYRCIALDWDRWIRKGRKEEERKRKTRFAQDRSKRNYISDRLSWKSQEYTTLRTRDHWQCCRALDYTPCCTDDHVQSVEFWISNTRTRVSQISNKLVHTTISLNSARLVVTSVFYSFQFWKCKIFGVWAGDLYFPR